MIINKENYEIKRTFSDNVSISLKPANATNTKIIYEVLDTNIANISDGGVINGVTAGETTAKIKIQGEKIEKNINIKVLEILNDIKLNKNSVNLYLGNTTTITATLDPSSAVNKDIVWSSSDENIAVVENGKITAKKIGKCQIIVKNTEEPIVEKSIAVTVSEKPVYSNASGTVEGATYINGILIVNKKYGLPSTYNPGVNASAYAALKDLQSAASVAGHSIPLRSGFRSYSTQTVLYNSYVSQYGETLTDTFSAKPGYSEHQTGLAFDVGQVSDSFGNTSAGQWLASNCHNYGFIIRYPKGKQAITGYKYEPWHIRYVGTSVATDIYNRGVCLEEYLGI